MEKNFILNIPDVSFYANAMRKVGYDNYEALCEFSDNSIEKDVNATFCNFSIVKTKNNKSIEQLIISDDGNGLSEKYADTFFNFGVSSKDATCYGGYGLGAKTAALSMGRRITLYTKQENSPIFKYVFDLDVILEEKKPVTHKVLGDFLTKEEKDLFFNNIKNPNHGTMIIVDKLDSLTCNTITSFKQTLHQRLSKNYSYILQYNPTTKITIDNDEIKPISYVGGVDKNGKQFDATLLNSVTTEFQGLPIKIECYYLETPYGLMDGKNYDIPVNQQNCGFYFFRNGRLVGGGLKPDNVVNNGAFGGDGHSSRFRVLVFYGGEMDAYINLATFNKMINDKKELNDKFRLFLKKHTEESYRTFLQLDSGRIQANRERKDAEKDAEMSKRIKNLLDERHLNINNKQAKNKKNEEEEKNNHPTLKGKRATHIKMRDRSVANIRKNSDWFGEYITSYAMSPYDDFYQVRFNNGKYDFIINGNHPCHVEVWDTLDDNQKLKLAIYFCTHEISIIKADLDDEARDILFNNLDIIKQCHNQFLHKMFGEIYLKKAKTKLNKQAELEFTPSY